MHTLQSINKESLKREDLVKELIKIEATSALKLIKEENFEWEKENESIKNQKSEKSKSRKKVNYIILFC